MISTQPVTKPAPLPGTARLGLSRGGVELRSFFRQKEGVIFVFALPPLLFALFGSIFRDNFHGIGISAGQLMIGGMIAAGLASTSFLSMGVGIAIDRDDRTLKRLRGTPLPAAAYFAGKLLLVAVSSVAEVALLLAVATLFFHVQLPDAAGWLTLVWVFALAVVSCALLGIAASGLARSGRTAPAVLNLLFLVLEFISGVFIVPVTTLPRWMIDIASVFPLKWAAQGMRSVFLPDRLSTLEVAGAWQHGMTALVLAGWCVAGLVLCLATFRWTNRDQR